MQQPAQPNVFQQASNALTGALGATGQGVNFRPSAMGYSPESVGAGTAVSGIQQYMNPYTQQIIDRTAQDIGSAQQQAMNQLGAQATAARAFGGSRQGVAESLTNQNFIDQLANTSAQLRQQGFQTALGASQQDVANRLNADLANQAARARAAEFGQGQELAVERQRLAAAQQLAGLGQQAFGFGQDITQQQQQFGGQQQALNQALINAARSQYGGFTGAPQTSIGLPLQALGAANMGQRTETQTRSPGLFGILGALSGVGGGFA